MEPATSRAALIVAHGSPADPAPQEAALKALAERVAGHLPGWCIRGATLAAPGALEAALEGLAAPLVYPFFMAEGWFTGTHLPQRLTAAGAVSAHQLAPFGSDPDLPALIAAEAMRGLAAIGHPAARTTLLIAAHGSQRSKTSSQTALALAATLARTTGFRAIRAGFVEEAPLLAEAARDLGPALCLPFFALAAGHVLDDIPRALAEAGFEGPLLAPIGQAEGVPALIAAALTRAPNPVPA